MNQVSSIIAEAKLIQIKNQHLEYTPEAPPSVVETLMAPMPALRNGARLTKSAIQLGALLHPPIVRKLKTAERRYRVLANFRTAEMCRGLSAGSKITVLLVPTLPAGLTTSNFLALTSLLSAALFGLDVVTGGNSLLRQVELLSPALRAELSPDFKTRTGLEKTLGLNRRRKAAKRQYASSPTSQQSLGLGTEDGDV